MKKNIIILAFVILFIIIGILLFFMPNNSNNTNIKTIKVNEVTRSVFYSPQYVAIAKNFFEDYGIEIELTTDGTIDTMKALLDVDAKKDKNKTFIDSILDL